MRMLTQAPRIAKSFLERRPQYGSPILDVEAPESFKRFHEKVDQGVYDPSLEIDAERALEDLLGSHIGSDALVELVREDGGVRQRDELTRHGLVRRMAWESQEGPITRVQLQEGYQGFDKAYRVTVMNCDSPAYQLEVKQS